MERQPPFLDAPAPGADLIEMVHEESMVRDIRAGVTPSQMVERKLASLGDSCPKLRSRMQTAALSRPA